MNTKLAINYWTLGGFEGAVPVREVLSQAHTMGWDGVELAYGAGEFATPPSSQDCQSLIRYAETMGMALQTMASGNYWGQSLSHPDAQVREAAVEFTKGYLQTAANLGVHTVLVIPGHVAVPWDASQPVVPYEDAWRWSRESLGQCIPLAERLGVNLALENVWNWFLTDPIAMASFIDGLGSERVGAYFDVGNCLINGYPEHWIKILGTRIKGIHVKNYSRTDCGGTIKGFGESLLTGDANWPAIMVALRSISYAGPITAEMIPFCRLPDLNLPDAQLAASTLQELKAIVDL